MHSHDYFISLLSSKLINVLVVLLLSYKNDLPALFFQASCFFKIFGEMEKMRLFSFITLKSKEPTLQRTKEPLLQKFNLFAFG